MSETVIRAFIAIELPPAIQQRLEQVESDLKVRLKTVPVRWVPAENIHLTLKFLGNVSVTNLEILGKILKSVVSAHKTCEISVGGLGAFPKIHHPRVIWVGLEIPPELMAIQHNIEVETAHLGYAPEDRSFSPHLTLGRVSRNATERDIHAIVEALEIYRIGFLGAARVESVHLFRSDLKLGGAVYTRLYSVHLGR